MSTHVPLTSIDQAIAYHQAGRLQEAEELYQDILQSCPNHPEANHNMGVLAVQMQQPAAGLPYFMAALKAEPTYEQYWFSSIDALVQVGQLEAAREVLILARQQGFQGDEIETLAARLKDDAQPSEPANADWESSPVSSIAEKAPSIQEINTLVALFTEGQYAEAASLAEALTIRFPLHGFGWKALGTLLKQMGQDADALAPMQKAAALSPNDAEIHSNLGFILHELGQLDEAEASYRRALEINPYFTVAFFNLGKTLHELNRLDEAEISYRKALEIKPDFAEVHYNLGVILMDLGLLDEAEACYRQALEIKPDYAEVHNNLGNILQDQRRLSEAESSYRRAVETKPNFAKASYNLGSILHELRRLDEAELSYRRALEIEPDYAEAHSNLGNTLKALGRLDEAETSYRQALKIKPDYAEAHSNLGNIFWEQDRLNETVICFRKALDINPELAETHSNLLFCLSNNEEVDAVMLFTEHCRFGEQFETALKAFWLPHSNTREPERCLQVGFVSADLRQHAVANFIEPILAHLSSYPQLELHAYYNHTVEDSVTERLRGYLKHWHSVVGLSEDALAEKIRADGIDILIDLSAHTANNRLLTFARKPAPLQVSWIAYPGTTGLSAMDYYFADRFFFPLGQFDDQFTEKIVRLPISVPFQPSKDAPSISILPALSNGYVTFGSFNRQSKLSSTVIALWSQLLRALPDSRLMLAGMSEDGKYDVLIDGFTKEGIERERLSFHPRCCMDDYLALHQQVDICLDTFPYNGGTTTFNALWMGVPTLTLAGHTVAARSGAGILGHVGLDAFVAQDTTDFVQKGLYWAGNLDSLASVRARLRESFQQSAIGQPAIVAAGVECALRMMWKRWCVGLPAESFEVNRQVCDQAMR